MNPTTVILSAPSRLHLGLVPGPDGGAEFFGGAGIMLTHPRTTVRFHPAKTTCIHGVNSNRAREFAETWLHSEPSAPRHFDLNVIEAPAEHTGLGSGTQLALAVGIGLNLFDHSESTSLQHIVNRMTEVEVLEAARKLGRAGRTVIGTRGFQLGGMIIDWGRDPASPSVDSSLRLPFPGEWPILLVTLPHPPGLHGKAELSAFQREIERHAGLRSEMLDLLNQQMLPGIQQLDFERFAAGTWEFGNCSGRIFERIQAGIFCSPEVASLVATLRNAGAVAVVQSSWGPTIGIIFPSTEEAAKVAAKVCNELPVDTEVTITSADNQGARIETDFQLPE